MALVRDMIFKAGPTMTKLIKTETDSISLKVIKKLTIKFDPFVKGVENVRDFSFIIHSKNLHQTNPQCLIKTEILTDRSEQSLIFELTNGSTLIIQCGRLSTLDIFQLMNTHITPLVPKEVQVEEIKIKKKKK